MSARKLDARTLRAVARRLRRDAAWWKRKGRAVPGSILWIERCEGKTQTLNSWADRLLGDARAIERAGGKREKR